MVDLGIKLRLQGKLIVMIFQSQTIEMMCKMISKAIAKEVPPGVQ